MRKGKHRTAPELRHAGWKGVGNKWTNTRIPSLIASKRAAEIHTDRLEEDDVNDDSREGEA